VAAGLAEFVTNPVTEECTDPAAVVAALVERLAQVEDHWRDGG
jgi:hypothetical protein